MPTRQPPLAAYVHVPFCASKCPYCDFDSYPGLGSLFDDYALAVIREIGGEASKHRDARDSGRGQALQSVYFGGGTPTLLPGETLSTILHALQRELTVAEDAEVTIEANPGTVEQAKMSVLRARGFNRISIGVQSLDDRLLRRIGRVHSAQQGIEAARDARAVGFANISLDLMFCLPGQTAAHWQDALDQAIALDPEHISVYELTIEEQTPFAELRRQGVLPVPVEDLRAEMYETAIRALTAAGFEHYEVSNFARPGFRCCHNLTYWRNEPYYGFGAGATSFVAGLRARRVRQPGNYIDAIASGADPVEFSERLEGRRLLGESLMLGLRILDGVDLGELGARTGIDVRQTFRPEIARLRQRGLVEPRGDLLRVTHRGLLLLDDVVSEFVA